MIKEPNYKNVTAHKAVAHVAEEMAAEMYEELCSKHDAFYKANPNRDHFVKTMAPELRNSARILMTEMLKRNDVSDVEKDMIWEALVNDKSLKKGGTSIAERIN